MHRHLLDGVATTGPGTAITWLGGRAMAHLDGYTGATLDVTLEISADGTQYETAIIDGTTQVVQYSTGGGNLDTHIPAGWLVRGNVITASSTSAEIDLWLSNG